MGDDQTAEQPAGATAPPTTSSTAELSDDDILAAMTAEMGDAADDELLDGNEEPPAKPAKGKAGKETPTPKPKDEDEGDDDELDEDDGDEDEDDEPEQTQPRSLQKARKLFDKGDVKGALKLALGLKDADLDAAGEWDDPAFANAKFRAFRKKVEKADTAARERDERQTARETQFQTYIETKVKPAIAPAVKILKLQQEYAKTRDPNILVQLTEDFTGETYDVAHKRVLTGKKDSPGDRRLLQKIDQLEAKLAKLEQPAEETPEQKQARAQTELKEYLGEIKEEIADHDVRKIPGAAKLVYKMLRKHYVPRLKGPSISIEKAADKVLRIHMRTLSRLSGTKPASAETPATTTTTRTPKRVIAHDRSETREAGVSDREPTDDEILRQMEIEMAQDRRKKRLAAGGKR